MKVAIDISGMLTTQTGTTVYTRELINALKKNHPTTSISQLSFAPSFSRKHRIPRSIDTLRKDLWWQEISLPSALKKQRIQLLHSPAFSMPYKPGVPTVVNIHDIHTYTHPNDFNRWHQLAGNHYIRRAVKHASHIITGSNFTRTALLETFPSLTSDRITRIYNGFADRFLQLNHPPSTPTDEPYIFCAFSLSPNKNPLRILEAFAHVAHNIPHHLIFAGPSGWKLPNWEHTLATHPFKARIHHLGFIKEKELPSWFQNADLFCFPSLYEGFGLPVLEAMASGTPVLTSNTTSLPEVIGNAGLQVDPYSVDAIASGLLQILTSNELSQTLSHAGKERAKQFSWKRCAKETMDVYTSVLSNNVPQKL